MALEAAHRELNHGLEGQIQQVARECRGEMRNLRNHFGTLTERLNIFPESLGSDLQDLAARFSRVEGFLSTNDWSLDKVLGLISKTQETIETEVRQTLALQDRRIMEAMMSKMVDERFRQSRKEEHWEKMRTDTEDFVHQQLQTVLKSIYEERKKDLQHFTTLLEGVKTKLATTNGEDRARVPMQRPQSASTVFSEAPSAPCGIFSVEGVEQNKVLGENVWFSATSQPQHRVDQPCTLGRLGCVP